MKGTLLENYVQWRISVVISLMIHLLVGLLIFLVPAQKKESGTPFITRLITPDELKQFNPPIPPLNLRRDESGVRQKPLSRSRPSLPETVKPVEPQKGKSPIPPVPETKGDVNTGNGDATAQQAGRESPSAAGSQKRSEGEPSATLRAAPLPLKEKLFDREIVERFAMKEDIKKDSSISFDTKEFKYYTYMMRLKEKIEGIWKYPNEAAARGIYGDLYIRFTIKRNGMLSDTELVRTSGHRSLDEAAMKALKDAEPFWPLPDEWGKDAISITGHFVYSLYGTYIR
ncbi:MAG: energy transducer TonB [Thermodesulfovibrionales bacterium]